MSKRIAVIGSGISGLTAAHLLSRRHQVVLFEKESRPGGHTLTLPVRRPEGDYRIDVGFIVFNDRTYPLFNRLLDDLGIQGQPTSMGFSVSDTESGLEYSGGGLNGFFAQRRRLVSPAHWRMLGDILRFNREARALAGRVEGDFPLIDYLRGEGYGEHFLRHYILPMGGAIWSCGESQMESFPARFFVRFFDHHGLLDLRNRPQWYVIPGGSRTYVDRLLELSRFEVRLASPVFSVRREAGGVTVDSAGKPAERFDHVVFACHPDQASALLADGNREERALLSAVPYQSNEVVLHTDERLLPANRRCWSSWNALLDRDPGVRIRVTYNMNILQGIQAPVTFCVTLNGSSLIAPEKVIARHDLFHPVFTPRGLALRSRFMSASGKNNAWFCGAWCGNGFHEDGVASAVAVARDFGEKL